MSSPFRWLTAFIVSIIWIGAARAATVETTDGSKFTGTVTEDEEGNVTIKLKKGSISFKKAEIKSINKDEGVAAPEATPAAPPVPATKPAPETPKPAPTKPVESKSKTESAPPPAPATPAKPPEPAPAPTAAAAKTTPPPSTLVPAGPAPGTAAGTAGRNAHEDNEPRDILVLKGGGEQRGFLVSETEAEIVFDCIMSGKNVSKTITSRTTFQRAEVESIKKLTDEQRADAKKNIANAAAQDKKDAHAEKNMNIESGVWPSPDPKYPLPHPVKPMAIRVVQLEHFTIESDINDELLSKLAFRLDKVFNAYAQHFGTNRNGAAKVRICIFNSMEEYYAAIGGGMKNPAFYSPDMKQICAGCDVEKYEKIIAEIRDYHAKLDQKLREWKSAANIARDNVRAEVAKAFDKINASGQGDTAAGRAQKDAIRSQETEMMLDVAAKEREVTKIQDEIFTLNRRNDVAFSELSQQMLAMLYHEGFHAFLDNFLFTPEQVKLVPRWLNEGLAQYFECARLENNRFVLGQEDRMKMGILRQFKKEDALLPLDKLVNGGPQDYLVHDMSNLKNSTKNYFQAWLLTHVLGEKGRLTRETLTAYVTELAKKTFPLDAMPIFSGISNEDLEKAMVDKLQTTFQANPDK